jgi:hypothetical protein
MVAGKKVDGNLIVQVLILLYFSSLFEDRLFVLDLLAFNRPSRRFTLFVTADHGNAEQMVNEQGGPHTAHTTNKGITVYIVAI